MLESRRLLASFMVTSTADEGPGSLRQAILDANSNFGADAIEFEIASDGPQTIQPISALPAITDPVTIDGTTQSNYAGSPIIELDGTLAGDGVNGLKITADDCVLRGLVVNRFDGSGVVLEGCENSAIEACFIGTDVTGQEPLANMGHGVYIVGGARHNRVGTNGDGIADEAERNVISGNAKTGVSISGTGSDGNWIAGNYIGIDATGLAALGNGREGVYVRGGAQSNLIGTNGDGIGDEAERNIISGSGEACAGIAIGGEGVDFNVVAGNFIGTDVRGLVPRSNGGGVIIFGGGQFNRIGTNGDGLADEAERNVISGNLAQGVNIRDAGTDHNVIAGNYIGTDVTGTVAIGNGGNGVGVSQGPAFNQIGTNGDGLADEAERNVVSGNGSAGILISDMGTDENVVAGNYIGVDATGANAVSNGWHGIKVQYGAQRNRIGTDGNGVGDLAERNVISGNASAGVAFQFADTQENVVAGNFIGVDAAGVYGIGNVGSGVVIWQCACANRIGTDGNGISDEAERNVISGNAENGIVIAGDGTSFNTVAGNLIGTDESGTNPLANLNTGINIGSGATQNLIGTDGDGVGDLAERNVVSGNSNIGIGIWNSETHANVIAGNFIGTDIHGTSALGNGADGIAIGVAFDNLVGGTTEVARNVISGNQGTGVRISYPGASGNAVQGNYVGLDVSGTQAIGNGGNGICAINGASANVIGGIGAGAGNVIAGNCLHGVDISSNFDEGNEILGNLIGADSSGTVDLGNGGSGVHISNSSWNVIGTGEAGGGNLISGNGSNGIEVQATTYSVFHWSEDMGGNGHYYVLSPKTAWPNAEVAAVKLGGHLADLSDVAEQTFVEEVILSDTAYADQALWIGLTDKDEEGAFVWTSGAPLLYTNWRDGDPDGSDPNEDYVAINVSNAEAGQSGAWSSETRWLAIHGIIELAAEPEASLLEEVFGSHDNTISGNLIGTDVTGSVALPNTKSGVSLGNGVQCNVIGTNGDALNDNEEGNVISGNGQHGVFLWGGAASNVVAGNFVGTNSMGTAAVPNGQRGVVVCGGSQANQIGTNGDGVGDLAERNVISGNTFSGVSIYDEDSVENVIAGNFVGVDATGLNPLGNGGEGVSIGGAARNTVGGVTPAMRNVISANLGNGVTIESATATENMVQGNYIGTDATGERSLANTYDGVGIKNGPAHNWIGGFSGTAGNVISGNAASGVSLYNCFFGGNTVVGNRIGLTASGSSLLGNGENGIRVRDASGNTIGGLDANSGNLVFGSALHGLFIEASRTSAFYWDSLVGGNGHYYVVSPPTTWVNAVALAEEAGGELASITSAEEQAYIEAAILSEGAYPNSPLWIGLTDQDCQGDFHWMTGEVSAFTNWHSGEPTGLDNEDYVAINVHWDDPTSRGTWSDVVGWEWCRALIEVTEQADVDALQALFGADNNTVLGNEISLNGGDGVRLAGDVSGNQVSNNSVFDNSGLGINLVTDDESSYGVSPNDSGDIDAGPNDAQNYPVIVLAESGDMARVQGTLNSRPESYYAVDFYACTAADASGFGEGERWLGSISVTTDEFGESDFDMNLPSSAFPGEWVTATATDAAGNTSEFSFSVEVDATIDLGAVDFKELSDLGPASGELWYRLEATIDGLLTAQATAEWTADQFSVSLFDPSDRETPLAITAGATPRLDHAVHQDQVYLLRVTSSAADAGLLLANLVCESDSAIAVYGTSQDDELIFNAAASREITINGVAYHYEDARVATVDFDGGEGHDLVWLYDSPGDDTLEAWPDRALLANSPSDSVPDFEFDATGIEDVRAYALQGGADLAELHGSEDADKFKSYEDSARLRAKNSTYMLRAKKFDAVVADTGSGGNDVAVFNDAETFTYNGCDGSSRVDGDQRNHLAFGFATIVVRAEGGENDVARFTGIPDVNDVFYFRSHKTQLVNASVKATARAFDEVHATAGGSGFDVARIYDTSGDDHLEVAGDTARLYHRIDAELDMLYEAIGFNRIKAYSTDGEDTTDIGDHTFGEDLLLYGWEE